MRLTGQFFMPTNFCNVIASIAPSVKLLNGPRPAGVMVVTWPSDWPLPKYVLRSSELSRTNNSAMKNQGTPVASCAGMKAALLAVILVAQDLLAARYWLRMTAFNHKLI